MITNSNKGMKKKRKQGICPHGLLGFVGRKRIVFMLALPVLELHYWFWRAGSDTLAASAPMPSARYRRKGGYRLVLALPVLEFHC